MGIPQADATLKEQVELTVSEFLALYNPEQINQSSKIDKELISIGNKISDNNYYIAIYSQNIENSKKCRSIFTLRNNPVNPYAITTIDPDLKITLHQNGYI